MNARIMLPPLIAVGILFVIWTQTSEALKRSGTWATRRTPIVAAEDPYARLDRVLAKPDTGVAMATLRDPFTFGRVASVSQPVANTSKPIARPAPPQPVVTAIVTDGEEARAILRFEGNSYSVKPGDLFGRFRVLSISADQVVVEDGREQLVLRRPTKGE